MDLICERKTETLNFSINVLVHVIFLFTVLSVLFVFVITKISTKTINEELSGLIEKSMESNIKISDEIKQNISEHFGGNVIRKIAKMYDGEDKTRKYNNKLVISSITTTIITLGFVLLFAILTTKYLCYKIPLKHILIENVIIFSCIAVVEFIFFKYIILKYIPVKPSYIQQQLLESIDNKLQ